MTDGVVVAIPARDEQTTLLACLDSVRAAADAISASHAVRIVVAADTCHDRTSTLVRRAARHDDRVRLIEGRWGLAGAARCAATDHGLGLLAPLRADATWVASTDADTVVPIGWLGAQLAHAAAGWRAVAGIVAIDDRDPILHARFVATYPTRLADGTHIHVHGANLGVRADAYTAVGGWSTSVAVGEDQSLWDALRHNGHPVLATTELSVTTSDRRMARAPNGFSARLQELVG